MAELCGLAGQHAADLGHGVAQLGGWVLEWGVVESLCQCFGAGAQAQHVPPAADLMEGGGGHRERRRGAPPDGQDPRDDPDPCGAQRDLGQHGGRVQPPPLGYREDLISQFVGEHGGPDDDVPPGLHRREPYAAPARGHDASSVASAGTGRGTVSHTAPAAASTSPPGPSSADPASSLRPSRPPGQAITRHWVPATGSAVRLAVIRPSRMAVSWLRPTASAAAIPLGQSSAAQTTSGRTLTPASVTDGSGVHGAAHIAWPGTGPGKIRSPSPGRRLIPQTKQPGKTGSWK